MLDFRYVSEREVEYEVDDLQGSLDEILLLDSVLVLQAGPEDVDDCCMSLPLSVEENDQLLLSEHLLVKLEWLCG